MYILFFLLFLLSLVFLIAGMIKPSLVNRNRKKELTRKQIAIGFSVLAVIFLILTAVTAPPGSSQSTQKQSSTTSSVEVATKPSVPDSVPTDTPIPTLIPTPISYDVNGFPENYEKVTVVNLAKVPSEYENKTLYFTCTVESFAKDSSGDASAINCLDPNDYTSVVQIDAGNWDLTKINQNDTIRVYGDGGGSVSGQNAFGANVTEAAVFGLYVNDITSGYSDSK